MSTMGSPSQGAGVSGDLYRELYRLEESAKKQVERDDHQVS